MKHGILLKWKLNLLFLSLSFALARSVSTVPTTVLSFTVCTNKQTHALIRVRVPTPIYDDGIFLLKAILKWKCFFVLCLFVCFVCGFYFEISFKGIPSLVAFLLLHDFHLCLDMYASDEPFSSCEKYGFISWIKHLQAL